ncbi:non-specific serine/threonine protein kinase [Ranunculus cassubicifolius]
MSPPPLRLTIITFLCLSQLAAANRCTRVITPCPPFDIPLPYPFSSTLGCGHPGFTLHCSSPHSFITINELKFAILHYEQNSSSLRLSPLTESTKNLSKSSHCSSTQLPTQSINLMNSPFRFASRPCSTLSVVKHCSNDTNLANLSCRWEAELVKKPMSLLHGCDTDYQLQSEPVCRVDVLDYLQKFLKWGIEVEWSETDEYFLQCNECRSKGKGSVCGYDFKDSKMKFLCFPSQSRVAHQTWIHRDNPNRIVILCTLLICVCILVLVGVITLIIRKSGLNSTKNEEDPTMLFLHRQRSASLLPPVFNYEELDSATNHFDTKRKIGDGGFGSVYVGQLYDNRIVAVKKLHKPPATMTRTNSEKAFCNEILILSSIQHPNLVKLHGYCSDSRGLLLVYDYVPNGTLADHLHGPKSSYRKGVLLWHVRVEIALQTAMAIEYLHFGNKTAIVHRDITSSNIFVEKDMRIKLGDFGLSRLLICTETSASSSSGSGYICTGPQGTPGYLDPDYHRSFRLTEKSDVYSFGVILFELISGMRAVDLGRDKRDVALADLVVSKIHMGSLHQVVDPVLVVEGEAMGTVDSMAELAFRCVANEKDDRPDAKEIVAELKRIKNRTTR